jgi:hypothetical protein
MKLLPQPGVRVLVLRRRAESFPMQGKIQINYVEEEENSAEVRKNGSAEIQHPVHVEVQQDIMEVMGGFEVARREGNSP